MGNESQEVKLHSLEVAKLLSEFRSAAAAAKSLQSCLTLCDLIDGSPSGSPSLGFSRPRILEWVAIAFSDQTSFSSVQFSSVAQSCPTLCDPMNRSTPGLPVQHQLPEFTQTHVHRVGCHPAISSSVVPFSSCPQSFPASESFPMSQNRRMQ